MIRHLVRWVVAVWTVMSLGVAGAVDDSISVSDGMDSYAVANLPTDAAAGGVASGAGWSGGWFADAATHGAVGNKSISLSDPSGLSSPGAHLYTSGPGYFGRVMSSPHDSVAGTVWISFLLKGQGLQAAAASQLTNANEISFFNGDFGVSGNLSFSLNTAGSRVDNLNLLTSAIRWRLNSFNDPANTRPADDDPHSVVLKVEPTLVTVWFDPPVGAEPLPATKLTSLAITNAACDRIQVRAAGGGALIRIDDFKLGTTWTAVSDPTMPTITAVSPTSGPTVATTTPATVTIGGTNFTSAASVRFGGVAAVCTVISATSISAQPPLPHAAGAVDVQVTIGTRVATLPAAFTYVSPTTADPVVIAPPTVSGIPHPGERLTADPGTWQPTPASFTYQWRRADDATGLNAVAIGAAASVATYDVSESDLGSYLDVVVVAGGSAPSKSASSSYVLVSAPKGGTAKLDGTAGSPKGCGLGAVAAMALVALGLGLRRRRTG